MTLRTSHLIMFAASAAAAAVAAVAVIATGNAGPSHAHHGGDDGAFIAHEWGTFTSVQGSDGVILDGLQHEVETLPGFVHSVTTRTDSPFRDLGDLSGNVPVRRTRSKMETPVIYFYTDRRRQVRVRVSYTRGLLSHFYPRPSATEGIDDTADTLDLQRIASTSAEWKIDVIPPREASADLPEVDPGNPYGFARDVNAAVVESAGERERFIFYRGLGHRAPSVYVVSTDESATVGNATGGLIPAAFAVEMNEDDARFIAIGAIETGMSGEFSLDEVALRPRREVTRDLSLALQEALVGRGLYPDEAAAMVRTWSESWFGDIGTRVLYLVPELATEAMLPLAISPTPDELVRVLVGRIEYMTPAQERAVRDSLTAASSSNETTAARGMSELASLGRFLEPKLRRVVSQTTDTDVKAAGVKILRQVAAPVTESGQ